MNDREQKLIIEMIANQADMDANQIGNDTEFMGDLGLDSLDMVELIMAFEELTECDEIDEKEAEKMKVVGDIFNYYDKNNLSIEYHNPTPIKNIGTHQTHCCIYHGCKYGDKDCPVANGEVKQEYPCEDCDNTEKMLLQSIEKKVIFLCKFISHSKTRMPYTYHHDYLRMNTNRFSGMSRGDVANNHESDKNELYGIAFLQVLDTYSAIDVVMDVEPDKILIMKDVCEYALKAVGRLENDLD